MQLGLLIDLIIAAIYYIVVVTHKTFIYVSGVEFQKSLLQVQVENFLTRH